MNRQFVVVDVPTSGGKHQAYADGEPEHDAQPTGHLLFVPRIPWYAPRRTGSGAARLARSVRDAEVGGSNPLSPTG